MIACMGERKSSRVRSMFSRIAGRYDLLNKLMTFGRDRAWRRFLVERLGALGSGRLLDVGAGTGDIAMEAAIRNPGVKVTAVDFCLPMILSGRRNRSKSDVLWCVGDALLLPFGDETFDAVSSGYLLRNVEDVRPAFSEQFRVLKPGGVIACLDTSPPRNPIMKPFILFYLDFIIPLLGKMIGKDENAYSYLKESTKAFVSPETLVGLMDDAGFKDLTLHRFMFGTQAVISGKRPWVNN